MDRKTADKFVSAYHSYGKLLNDFTELSSRIEDKETAKRIRRSLADTHNTLLEYIIFDIGKLYPELVPKDQPA